MSNAALNKTCYTLSLFHDRLAHSSLPKLKHLTSCTHFDSANFLCKTCQKAKLYGQSFSWSEYMSDIAFKLIRLNMWGPYHVPTRIREHYFLTIIDDFSRRTWTYLLKFKSRVSRVLENFLIYVQNHFNTCPKYVRGANRTEFIGKECQNFFLRCGIVYQKTTSYTPQQNKRVEQSIYIQVYQKVFGEYKLPHI